MSERKRPRSVKNVAFINAGNDLRSHTLDACSTIGPAGLNFRVRDGNGWIPRGKITDKLRRLASVNEPPSGGEWEPAAEILRLRLLQRRISTPNFARRFGCSRRALLSSRPAG